MAVVKPGSVLERQKWVKEGMIQKASQSFWTSYQGQTAQSPIFVNQMKSAKDGNRIVFDFDGNYAAAAFTGTESAYGKAGDKAKFSDGVDIDVVITTVNNGRKFDGKAIDSLELAEHGNSRSLLADNWVRLKDQAIFDTLMGKFSSPTHIITPSGTAGRHAFALTNSGDELKSSEDKWTFDFVQELEEKLMSGDGFSIGSTRRPLEPYNGKFIVMLDSLAHLQLMQDSAMREVLRTADVRGENNMLLKNVIGQFGSLVFVKMPHFFGTTVDKTNPWKTKVEIAGARRVSVNDNTAAWQGDEGYNGADQINTRSFVIGANAMKFGVGKDADYMLQTSQDFGRTSESALELYVGTDKTQLKAETVDYDVAKVAGFDYGIIAVDAYGKN